MNRCPWCGNDELYVKYHDEEWGVPVHDDRKHFEFLVLESAQAGLSWLTILKKRENYRKAYDDFDANKISEYDDTKIEELMQNAGIIRNRRKIEASINNAKRFLEIQKEFGSFDNYFWSFVNNKVVKNHWNDIKEVPATIKECFMGKRINVKPSKGQSTVGFFWTIIAIVITVMHGKNYCP